MCNFKLFLLVLLLIFGTILLKAQHLDWVKVFAGTNAFGSITPDCIKQDRAGNLYISGLFSSTVDFNPGTAVYPLTENGPIDAFIVKLDSFGNFLWAKRIGGADYEYAFSFELDSFGNVYVVGMFQGIVDFDPGVGVFNLQATPSTASSYLLKLDTDGNFIWAKKMDGSFSNTFKRNSKIIAIDKLGYLYLTGQFTGLVDLDPGAGYYPVQSATSGNSDLFVIKLDDAANLVWAKTIRGPYDQYPNTLEKDKDDNLYIGGRYERRVDFDPGAGQFYLNDTISAGFLLKLDKDGNFLWAAELGTQVYSLVSDASGSIYASGWYFGNRDFNPGSDNFMLTSTATAAFFVKLDSSSNFQWAGSVSSDSYRPRALAVDSVGALYAMAEFSGIADVDPGAGTYQLQGPLNTNMSDILIQKLDPNGNFQWARSLGSGSDEAGFMILKNDKLYLTGSFDATTDFDLSSDTLNISTIGYTNAFLLKLSLADSCSNLAVTIDSIANIGCISNGMAIARGIGGFPPYYYSWETPAVSINDSIAVYSNIGIYNVTVTDFNGCKAITGALIDGPRALYTDFNGSLALMAPFRKDTQVPLGIEVFNDGCLPSQGLLKLVFQDSLVQYFSSDISPQAISGDTLIWSFSNLALDSLHFMVTPVFTVVGNIFGIACFDVIIEPLADEQPANNVFRRCFEIENSFDPNDKTAYPLGQCPENYILNNQKITYTVRFQNTGNAPAIDLYVKDSISTDFDINTLRVVGKSHSPLITEIRENIVYFRFPGIYLPDSSSNEAASHGAVVFEINPKQNLPDSTVIANFVEIYFDNNPPVLTDTVFRTLVNEIPVCKVIEPIDSIDYPDMIVFPNPTTGKINLNLGKVYNPINLKIFNNLGALIKEETRYQVQYLETEITEGQGIYFLRITDSKDLKKTFKVVKIIEK